MEPLQDRQRSLDDLPGAETPAERLLDLQGFAETLHQLERAHADVQYDLGLCLLCIRGHDGISYAALSERTGIEVSRLRGMAVGADLATDQRV